MTIVKMRIYVTRFLRVYWSGSMYCSVKYSGQASLTGEVPVEIWCENYNRSTELSGWWFIVNGCCKQLYEKLPSVLYVSFSIYIFDYTQSQWVGLGKQAPNNKKKTAQRRLNSYAPAASFSAVIISFSALVIRQFSKLFSTPFHPFQLLQIVFIYQGEDTEQNAVYCVSQFEILQILWDLEFQPK